MANLDAAAVNEPTEGNPPDSRTGSTETVSDQETQAAPAATLIEVVGSDQYSTFMAQALSTDFWGTKPQDMNQSDLFVLIGALNADRLALGRELDVALQQLASPGAAGSPLSTRPLDPNTH